MAYIVDTTLFQAEGAFLSWQVVARRLGMIEHSVRAATVKPAVLQLRWMIKREVGLPTEPYSSSRFWRRASVASVTSSISSGPEALSFNI